MLVERTEGRAFTLSREEFAEAINAYLELQGVETFDYYEIDGVTVSGGEVEIYTSMVSG